MLIISVKFHENVIKTLGAVDMPIYENIFMSPTATNQPDCCKILWKPS